MKMDFLIGSTFPLVLIRREVRIRPYSIDVLKKLGQNSICHSFWGHSNTIAPANKILGFDVSPKLERPVLTLTDKGLPV